MAALEDLGFMTSADNIDNEVEILHSKSLIKDVVDELKLHTTYMYRGRISKVELYPESGSPVGIGISDDDLQHLKGVIETEFHLAPDNSVTVTGTAAGKPFNGSFTSLPGSISTEAGTLTFTYNPEISKSDEERVIVATAIPPMQAAKMYAGNLSIEPTSKTTSILNITLKSTN